MAVAKRKASRPRVNGRALTRGDVVEAVEHVRDEVIVRIDASDKVTEEKIGRVRDAVAVVRTEVAEAKRVATDGIAETHSAIGKVDAKVSTVQLTVAKMIGWAAGAGAIAGVVVGIVSKLLTHS